MRTIAAVFISKLGDLIISQAALLLDTEVGEHRVDGESIGVVHGGGLRRKRRGRDKIGILIEALAVCLSRRGYTQDPRLKTRDSRLKT
jgi:hypothetical protein